MSLSHLIILLLVGLALPGPTFADDSVGIQAALEAIDSSIAADHYEIARPDLNGDGKADALALMNGKSGYCGSGGCTLFVLRATADGFSKAGAIRVVNRPIYLRGTSHHGMRDLLVAVRGGGASPGFAEVSFDGTSYPLGPGDPADSVEQSDTLLFAEPFDETMKLLGVSFHIRCKNEGATNTVTIKPDGLSADSRELTATIDGAVTGSEVADLDVDGSPEVYVYVSSTDGLETGSVVAYGVNNKKSLSQILLPELSDDEENRRGYRGRDEFAVVETTFARRFPIYSDGEDRANTSGRIRQLQYKLKWGEAGWILKLDRSIEY